MEREAFGDAYTETPTYAEVKAEFDAIRKRLDEAGVEYEIAEEDCLINTGDFYIG